MLKTLRDLLRDRSAQFATVFAISIVPIIGGAGVALDFNVAYNRQQEIQHAADSAVLAGLDRTLTTDAAIKSAVKKNFQNRIREMSGSKVKIAGIEVETGKRIKLTATTTVPLTLARVIGLNSVGVQVLSEATREIDKNVEVALVLDNTYSMIGQKMTDLKEASKSLVTTLKNSDPGQDKIRMSIVPFSVYVNVGLGNRSKSWINVPANWTSKENYCWEERPVLSKSGCRTVTGTGYYDGTPYSYDYEQCDQITYGDPVKKCESWDNNHVWNGCVGSRPYPLDTKDGVAKQKYTGLLDVGCGAPLLPLTNNYSNLYDAIDSMWVNDETYIQTGILWGFNVLSPGEPFPEATAYGNNSDKYMIVMTDGTNTRSPNYPEHWNSDADKADQLMLETCTNAKKAGIILYTVAVGVNDAATQQKLASCATDATKAISIADSGQLLDVFQGIAGQIVGVRLTR